MKVLFLTSLTPQNVALANLIHNEFELIGVVYENRFSSFNRIKKFLRSSNYNPIRLLQKITYKLQLRKIDQAITQYISNQYKSYKNFPTENLFQVDFINNPSAFDFIKNQEFDIIVVSGTMLVKAPIIELKPKYGIINLHTGLSPYFNGGPSCTFWCLYENKLDYIGSTVMFIDQGIDSGKIILSDTIDIEKTDSHESLEFKAIDLGNKLIIRSLMKLKKEPNFKGVEQKLIGKGKTYFSKDFTPKKRIKVKKLIKNGLIKNYIKGEDTIKTFPI